MMELTLTAKGQVFFNKGLLEHLGAKSGEKIAVTRLPGGRLEICAAEKQLSISEFHKIAEDESQRADTGVRLSAADIQKAVAQAYVEHGLRGLA
ncbi:MAG: AbrB/MazE/SpoVT family DNA-binding domain-containing protein [Actinomycetaceae bacterium]|nr:AbrB/MazE/SpoVT family DNA-binding domain-containing protein [Actinomycetaceae bacterium]